MEIENLISLFAHTTLLKILVIEDIHRLLSSLTYLVRSNDRTESPQVGLEVQVGIFPLEGRGLYL